MATNHAKFQPSPDANLNEDELLIWYGYVQRADIAAMVNIRRRREQDELGDALEQRPPKRRKIGGMHTPSLSVDEQEVRLAVKSSDVQNMTPPLSDEDQSPNSTAPPLPSTSLIPARTSFSLPGAPRKRTIGNLAWTVADQTFHIEDIYWNVMTLVRWSDAPVGEKIKAKADATGEDAEHKTTHDAQVRKLRVGATIKQMQDRSIKGLETLFAIFIWLSPSFELQ